MKRNAFKLLVGTLILMMVLAACGGPPASTGAAGDTIKIGGSLCLTGIQAPLDEPAMRGAQLAVDYLNSQGGILGKKLEFVNLDGKSDPVTVGNNAVQLVQEGVVAIVAPSDFDFGGPASREAQKAGIVGISPAASSPLYGSNALGDKQFTMSMWNTTMGAAAAEYAYNELGYRSVYVVTDTFIDYTKSLSRYFIVAFKKLGGDVIFEDNYTQGDQDFSAQLARIKGSEKKPDFLYISSYMPDLATIIRTVREAGLEYPVIGGDSYDDPGLFSALGAQYGSDVYFVTHSFVAPNLNADMDKFMQLYKDKYGKDVDTLWVATGWDVIMVLAQAMQKAGTTGGAAMAKAMEDNEWNLLTGKLNWSPADTGHEPDIEAPIVQLNAGVPKFIGWFRPAYLPPP
jgi:branched-chain amino acid transport system substrate-binding protein